MPKAFEKTDSYIAPTPDMDSYDPPWGPLPLPTAGDIDSGMQRATSNGVIGIATESAGVSAGGAVIGGTTETDFHISIG